MFVLFPALHNVSFFHEFTSHVRRLFSFHPSHSWRFQWRGQEQNREEGEIGGKGREEGEKEKLAFREEGEIGSKNWGGGRNWLRK